MTALALPIRLPRKAESLPLPRRRWNPWGDFVRFASGKSNFLAKTIADLVYSSTAFTPNATIFFALWTATLSATSTGSTAGEASYTGYARVGVTNNATQFPAATGSSSAAKSNANAVVFGQNTGVSSQTVISGATCSASSAGNIYHWGDIASTVINVNDTPQINASGFALTES